MEAAVNEENAANNDDCWKRIVDRNWCMHRKTSSRKWFHLIDVGGDTKEAGMDQHSVRRTVGTGAFRGPNGCIRKVVGLWTHCIYLNYTKSSFLCKPVENEHNEPSIESAKPPSWIDERSGMSG